MGFLEWLQWSPHPQLQGVVWCSECNVVVVVVVVRGRGSCSCSVVDAVEILML